MDIILNEKHPNHKQSLILGHNCDQSVVAID